MIIEFETETRKGSWDTWEIHRVKVDGKVFIEQSEGIEPEDAVFYRDLNSPFDCESVVKAAIDAALRGEKVDFIHTELDN